MLLGAINLTTPIRELLNHVALKNLCKLLDQEKPNSKDWRGLYQQLRLPPQNMTEFKTDARGPSAAILQDWYDSIGKSKATLHALMQALDKMLYASALEQLEEDIGVKVDNISDHTNMSGKCILFQKLYMTWLEK